MISYIKGELIATETDRIIVENNGIGYNIFVPASELVHMPVIGSDVKIHTFFYVKEDLVNLYGFITREELDIFKLLITVNGIGPKGALSIMSILTVDKLKLAIITGDAKAISKAPGVGSKTAQRIIIDLKDKFKNDDIVGEVNELDEIVSSIDNISEAIMALTSLGYTQTEAKNSLKGVDTSLNVDELLKIALKNLL